MRRDVDQGYDALPVDTPRPIAFPKETEKDFANLTRFTTKETAEYFGVTASTVYNWIKDGCLKAEEETLKGKTGRVGKYIIDYSELQRIDREGRVLIRETRKKWVRMVWHKNRGEKIR